MTISLRTNIAALKAERQLDLSVNSVSKSFQRLSSGLRINDASDDPGGIQIADLLRADARIATLAIRNASDGISATEIGIDALSSAINVLSRMLELAQQSANGTFTQIQRSALDSEFKALGSEVQRIAETTRFNGITLLSNSRNIDIQVGLRGDANSFITIRSTLGTLESVFLAAPGSRTLSFSIIANNGGLSQIAANSAIAAVQGAIDTLTVRRSQLAASENRLQIAVDYLMVARENFIAAEGRIRDADAATEVADLVKNQVIRDSATAILAQANLQPQQALLLLNLEGSSSSRKKD